MKKGFVFFAVRIKLYRQQNVQHELKFTTFY